MDLGNLKPKSDEVIVELKHPSTGEVLLNDSDDTPMTISLVAPHTKEYKSRLFKMSQERLKNQAEAKAETLDFDTYFNFSVSFLSDMTKDWNITLDGECPSFSSKAANLLYSEYDWVKEQVESDLNSYDAFTKD